MGLDRKIARTRVRRAYDILGRRWRDQLRSQRVMDEMGISSREMDAQRVGRRPPISVFSLMVREMPDPVASAREESPREFLEYAAEFVVPEREHGGMGVSWRGWRPRSPGSEAPQVPLEGLGEDGRPGPEGEVQAATPVDGPVHDRDGAGASEEG